MRNAVVVTITGAVKRYGNCDFSAHDDFDGDTETQTAIDTVKTDSETCECTNGVIPEDEDMALYNVVDGDFELIPE